MYTYALTHGHTQDSKTQVYTCLETGICLSFAHIYRNARMHGRKKKKTPTYDIQTCATFQLDPRSRVGKPLLGMELGV